MKQPLTAPQQQQVKSNFNKFSMGIKSCGMVDINKFMKNKTFMRNIPKLLMMSAGSKSIHKDFKPILEKFGIKTLTIPKTLHSIIDRMQGLPDVGQKVVKTIAPKATDVTVKEVKTNVEEKGVGRLYLGRGKANKYQEILNKLKSTSKK